MNKWVTGYVIKVNHWTENLFSIILNAKVNPFIAGQFTKLGLEVNGKKIQRAYSYVNSPKNNNLEFYLVNVPEGKLSPLLHALIPGDNLIITKDASGTFILKEIPYCKNLWMLATGTALGPYLSILEQGEELERFQQVILVHAVRFVKDFSYLPQMLKLKQKYNGKLRIQTIVSREKSPKSLSGRIPNLIANGLLESAVNLKLDSKNSHVMLCGNPQMIHDTQEVLKIKYGMYRHFKHKPGHVTSEFYW